MDWMLLIVYTWVAIISLFLIICLIIMAFFTKKLIKVDVELSYDFFKNLIYALFTGVIVTIIIEVKNNPVPVTNPVFWLIGIPLTFILIVIFTNFALIYLNFLDVIFGKKPLKIGESDSRTLRIVKAVVIFLKKVKLYNLSNSQEFMVKQGLNVQKHSIEDYFREHQLSFLVLSIFLIITFQLTQQPQQFLSVALASISALISYACLIAVTDSKNKKLSFGAYIIEALLLVFVITFCVWVILNIIIKIPESNVTFGIIIWLVLMLVPGYRYLRAFNKV